MDQIEKKFFNTSNEEAIAAILTLTVRSLAHNKALIELNSQILAKLENRDIKEIAEKVLKKAQSLETETLEVLREQLGYNDIDNNISS